MTVVKNVVIVIVAFIAFTSGALAQTCFHGELSKNYDFRIRLQRIKSEAHDLDSCIITVAVMKKGSTKSLQTIQLKSNFLFYNVFKHCSTVRSYITGRNKNKEALDGDYGDFIVADFNFDGKDDFAVKNDSGGQSGPTYNFYLQNNLGHFSLNSFLTTEVEFFPTTINAKKKLLVTYVPFGVCGLGEHVYSLNDSNGKWKEKSHREINICK